MLRRSFVVVLLVLLALAGCGGSNEAGSDGATFTVPSQGAAVLVTTDCGKTSVVKKTVVEPGQTAMRALNRVADIETDSGGKFVTGIGGVEQDTGKKLAWLYYINGQAAEKGATEIKLESGDVEWWDLHNYEQECAVVPPEAQ